MVKNKDLNLTLKGKKPSDLNVVLQGTEVLSEELSFVLFGTEAKYNVLNLTLKGKKPSELNVILATKTQSELGFILKSEVSSSDVRRLTLLDPLDLRDTSVYSAPREMAKLGLVYGDFTTTKIPCTALDVNGIKFHICDRPIMSINTVYVDGSPVNSGFRKYTSYQDETGQAVACIIFDKPQYTKRISVNCKGIPDDSSGALIENPADFLRHIILNIQKYDESTIDKLELAKLYSACLSEEIKIAVYINEEMLVRSLFDDLAKNIHARWLISDGKSVMKLRWQ